MLFIKGGNKNEKIILPEEQTKEIQLFVANLIKNEIETVKEDSGQISPFLNKNILRLVVKKSPTGESTHYFFFMIK
ncbi:hypothetical protein [Streptococcus suis]|uniref:hypothetical protein n=1 Tax=Streptococcus suis TaxID=1307 RepID=UPI002410408B|nr:hypothetical protein [Streptococcus suis]MDG3137248.1 hypothetical protein [Streptococcus suis]